MENEEELSVPDSNGFDMLTPQNPPPRTEKSRINGESLEDRVPVARCSKRTSKDQNKKKDDRSLESLKKALNGVSSADDKIAFVCEKYAELLEENRKLVVSVKQGERKLGQIQREKEQLQADHSKVVLTRSRLESLCRELQRQNKAVKEESLARIRDEEEKRKELSARFNVTLNEITSLMTQNTEKNNKLRDENKELTDKFKTLCEQYELREQQVEKLFKQNQLESKLSETKMAKVKMELYEEKELLLRELASYQVQCQEFSSNETALRSQITMYSDKYDEFQQALARSNEVFASFKTEMEKMSKKIHKLEKETTNWKTRWEKSHQALVEMAADKQQRDAEMLTAARQMAQLQRLCRTLQEQRTKLIGRLRELGEDVGKPETTVLKKEEEALVKAELPKPSKPSPNIVEVVDAIIESSPEPEDEDEKVEMKTEPETKATVNNTKNNNDNKKPTPKSVSNPPHKSSSNDQVKTESLNKDDISQASPGDSIEAKKAEEATDVPAETVTPSIDAKDQSDKVPETSATPEATKKPTEPATATKEDATTAAPVIPSQAPSSPKKDGNKISETPVTPTKVAPNKNSPSKTTPVKTPVASTKASKGTASPNKVPPNKTAVTPTKVSPNKSPVTKVTPSEASPVSEVKVTAPETGSLETPVAPEVPVTTANVPVTTASVPEEAAVTKVVPTEAPGSAEKVVENTEAVKSEPKSPSASNVPSTENKKKPKDGGRKKKK